MSRLLDTAHYEINFTRYNCLIIVFHEKLDTQNRPLSPESLYYSLEINIRRISWVASHFPQVLFPGCNGLATQKLRTVYFQQAAMRVKEIYNLGTVDIRGNIWLSGHIETG